MELVRASDIMCNYIRSCVLLKQVADCMYYCRFSFAGKSTVLHSLRGTLPLLDGGRKENPTLRLGMFTQDLAQELDPTSRAVDLATAYAREGSDGDISVSDLDARSVMGHLGLQGDKPLRKLGDLSGGEKARVALAMFALKPSNLYLLDEVRTHWSVVCCLCVSNLL